MPKHIQPLSMPIKVLNITPNGSIGGRERQLFLLSKEFKRYGEVVFDTLFLRPEGPFYEKTVQQHIKVHILQFHRLDPRRVLRLWQIFRQYDILNFWGVNNLCFTVALLTGKPAVFCLQGTRAILGKSIRSLMGHFFNKYFSRLGKSATDDAPSKIAANETTPRNDAISGSFPNALKWSGAKRLINRGILRAFLLRCSKVIVPSRYLLEFCQNYFGLATQKIAIIHNAFDPDEIVLNKSRSVVRAELGLREECFVVGTAARFDPRKRLDRLVKTMSLLPSEIDVKAVIFGDGEPAMAQSLVRQMEELGVRSRILLPGFRPDIFSYLNAIDFFVLPSDSEGLPLAILESLYLKLPTAVFADGGGVHEVVKNGKTGFVVKGEKDLASLIQKHYSDRLASQTIVAGGYRHVLNHFTVTKIALKYRRAFKALIDTQHPSSVHGKLGQVAPEPVVEPHEVHAQFGPASPRHHLNDFQ